MSKGSVFPKTQVPSTIKNLLSWVVADDCATGQVATWPDRVSKLNNYTQATSGFQPICFANVIAGHNVVRFDGVDDFIGSFTSYPLVSSSETTIFIVAKSAAVANRLMSYASSVGSGRGYCFSGASGYTFNIGTSPGGSASLGACTTTNFNIITNYRTGTTLGSSVNNGAASTATNANIPLTDWAIIYLGGNPSLAWLSCDIAEVIVYGNYLAASDIVLVNQYLSNKYGIAIS